MPFNLRFQSARRNTGPSRPHGCEDNYFKMGCAASKPMIEHAAVNDWYPPLAKGISMPTHARDHMQFVDDFQIVPLAGSRYGIMKVEAPSDAAEDSKDLIHGDFMKEALKRLDQLDVQPDSRPKSWLESTSMLEDLKPGLEKYFSEVGGVKEVAKPGSGEKSTSRIHSERYDVSDAFSNEAVAQSEGEKVSNKGTNSQLQGRDQNARVNCQSYISAVSTPNGRSKDSKSFRGTRSLSKLFSFGAQAKRGTRSVRSGKTGGEGVACQKDVLEDSLNSLSEPRSSLFDADFLASFEDVMKKVALDDWDSLQSHAVRADSCTSTDASKIQASEPESKGSDERFSEAQLLKLSRVGNLPAAFKRSPATKQIVVKKPDPLERFERVFLPGAEKAVVLYTTSLRGVRKTFEDCSNVRAVLQSFGISIDERDISMHQDFRNELRAILGQPMPVPQLLIKSRYIGGVEEVLLLHEDGQLGELLEGMPTDETNGRVCDGCGGVRFVPCLECSGSRKLVNDDDVVVRCPHCNENGLMQCPLCSY